MVFDAIGRGDGSFNDSAARGYDAALEQLGVEGNEQVPAADGSDRADKLSLLCEDGYNPVLAVGFLFTEPLTAVAAECPDTSFGIVDSVVDAPNVSSLVFAEHQGSFLVGAAAALEVREWTHRFRRRPGGRPDPSASKPGTRPGRGPSILTSRSSPVTSVPPSTAFTDPAGAKTIVRGDDRSRSRRDLRRRRPVRSRHVRGGQGGQRRRHHGVGDRRRLGPGLRGQRRRAQRRQAVHPHLDDQARRRRSLRDHPRRQRGRLHRRPCGPSTSPRTGSATRPRAVTSTTSSISSRTSSSRSSTARSRFHRRRSPSEPAGSARTPSMETTGATATTNGRGGSAASGVTTDLAIEPARHRQALPRRGRQRRDRPHGEDRVDPCHRRGERGRQVDVDEDPLRHAGTGRGHDRGLRPAGALPIAEGGHRLRHRHGPPALHARRQLHRPRERRPRERAQDRRDDQLRRGPGKDRGAVRSLRPRRRPERARRGARRRRAPAGRDPQGPLPRGPDPHPRRAHRRTRAPGGRRALRQPARPHRRGRHRDLHLAQARRGAHRRRCDHRDPRRQDRRRDRRPIIGHRPRTGRADGRIRPADAGDPRIHGHRRRRARGRRADGGRRWAYGARSRVAPRPPGRDRRRRRGGRQRADRVARRPARHDPARRGEHRARRRGHHPPAGAAAPGEGRRVHPRGPPP